MTRTHRLITAVASVALVAGLVVSLLLINSHSSDAQPGPTGTMRVAVVDFTRLGRDVTDVQLINQLMQLIQERAQKENSWLEGKIKDTEKNLQELENYDKQDTPDWDRETEKYLELLARYESVKAIAEFEMKKYGAFFSGKLLAKMLDAIRNHASKNYDVVLKVLGTPGQDEMEKLGQLGEAMQFNLNRAREVLFYEPGKVNDITDRVARMINANQDAAVSIAVQDKIKEVQKQIDDIK
ncbi:MAG: hypothetical protein AB7K09_10420, partial [Planctomycetota bacterium]